MKKTAFLLGLTVCLTAFGCKSIYGPVKEVRAFAEEKEEVISQMGKKLEANPTEAGVDEARKIFEAKKESLKAKRHAIDSAPKAANSDWMTELWRLEERHQQMLEAIGNEFTVTCSSDPCRNKWQALEKDFQDTVKGQ